MTNKEMEAYLQQQIPITLDLGVRVDFVSDSRVEVFAPLKPNRNHMGTAFGGSLNSILLLACYSWLFNKVKSRGFEEHIVLKKSEIQYFFPVEQDFKAICESPQEDELNKFWQAFQRKGKARILLTASITTSKGKACELRGEFVTVEAAK